MKPAKRLRRKELRRTRPVDIDGDIYRDGDGEASYLVLPG
jgi:hypothetical protein